jgi:hypothetical protein
MNGIKFPVFFLGKNFQHLESCLLIKIKNKKIKLLYFQEDIYTIYFKIVHGVDKNYDKVMSFSTLHMIVAVT